MSIAASLNTLRGVRDAIRDAIVGKGGTLPVGSPMGSYAEAITNLPSGSGEIPFRSRLTVPGDTDPWHLTNLTATELIPYAFYSDTLVISVSLPAVTSIGSSSFYGCTSLTSVSLPLVTNTNTNSFYGCTSLTTADFSAVTSISANAFRNCTSLTSLTLSNTSVATLSSISNLNNTPIASGTGYVYVPDDLVDQYKTANNWSTYANQILPLSQKP